MAGAEQAAEKFAFASGCGCSRTGWALCRPCGTRLMNLIQPGTEVPGYRLFRPCRDCLVPVSKALRTSQQIPEKSAVASRKKPAGALSPETPQTQADDVGHNTFHRSDEGHLEAAAPPGTHGDQ